MPLSFQNIVNDKIAIVDSGLSLQSTILEESNESVTHSVFLTYVFFFSTYVFVYTCWVYVDPFGFFVYLVYSKYG